MPAGSIGAILWGHGESVNQESPVFRRGSVKFSIAIGNPIKPNALSLFLAPMTKSLLRYPGGKTRAVKHILPYFPAETRLVLSPFLGGASVELALCDKGIKVYGYDAFQHLITFW